MLVAAVVFAVAFGVPAVRALLGPSWRTWREWRRERRR